MSTVAGDSFSRDLDLSSLLDGIAAGSVALPNFQRDFDWNEPDVVSLLATVLCGWPAGSLLLMSGDPTFFKVREFDSAPPLRRGAIEHVVLDGQQRLTSLFHAFRGAGPKQYAIWVDRALQTPVTAEGVEDALAVLKADDLAREATRTAIHEGRLVPLSVAISPADYYDWRDELLEHLDPDMRGEVSRKLATLYKNVLSHAHRYKFPSMLLDKSLNPEAVARIFERINKTGMRLSTFDLLVARSYKRDWNLREIWQDARDERPNLEKFVGEDGLAVAQSIALRSPANDVRQPAVLGLSPERVQGEWDRHVDAMDAACAFLVESGCLDIGWLPYRAQLLPLAALAVDFDLHQHRDLLLGWLWASSFALSYDVASSTVASEDYSKLKDAISAERPLDAVYRVSRGRLSTATRGSSGALWRAFRWLVMHQKPLDIVTGERLEAQSADALSMVTVLPRIAAPYDGSPPHLLVLSQALCEKSSVRRLRSRPLGLRTSQEVSEDGLRRQFLPTRDLDEYLFDWRALVQSRLSKVEDALESACGPLIRFEP